MAKVSNLSLAARDMIRNPKASYRGSKRRVFSDGSVRDEGGATAAGNTPVKRAASKKSVAKRKGVKK